MPSHKLCAAVIGDVIGSRRQPDRRSLQQTLGDSFDKLSREVSAIQDFQMTLGDEFQGLFSTIGHALNAALQLSLDLLPDVEVRFGVGWGELQVHDPAQAPFVQDGPTWWRAREALERVAASEKKRRWPRGWKTALGSGDADRDHLANALLICRDALLSRMDEKDLIITLGLLRGEEQGSLARRLKISQSAVAQRQQGHGAYAILRAQHEIEGLVG